MPIDPNIALSGRPVQFPNMMEQAAQMISLKNAMTQGRMANLQEQQLQTDITEGQQFKSALQRGATPEELTGISPSRGIAYQKNLLDLKKTKLEHDLKQTEFIGQMLGGVKDQASYEDALTGLLQAGVDVSKMGAQYDPATVAAWREKGMTITQQLENQHKAVSEEIAKAKETREKELHPLQVEAKKTEIEKNKIDVTAAGNKNSLFPLEQREQTAKTTIAESEAALGPKMDENRAQQMLVSGTPQQKEQAKKFLLGLAEQKGREAVAAQNAANGGMGGGGAYSGSTGPTTERNPEILKKQPTGIANQVIRIVEGREPLPGGMALKTPYWQNLLRLAGEYEPGFDATQWRTRLDTRSDFAKGKAAGQIRSLNTLIKHLNSLWNAADKLDNTGVTGSNKVTNWAVNLGKEALGSEGLKQWDVDATAAGGELAALLKGGVPDKAEIEQQAKNFNRNDPKKAQRTAILEALHLAYGRLAAVNSQYENAFKSARDFKFTNAASEAALKRMGLDPNVFESEAGGQAGAPTVPSSGNSAIKPKSDPLGLF